MKLLPIGYLVFFNSKLLLSSAERELMNCGHRNAPFNALYRTEDSADSV
jgi:hypothetical protein